MTYARQEFDVTEPMVRNPISGRELRDVHLERRAVL
jgi:hypothetical protein